MKIQLTATVTQVIEVDDDLDMVESMRKVTAKMESIASDFEIDGWDTITDFNFSASEDEDPPVDDDDDADEDDDAEDAEDDGEGGDEEVTAV